MELLTVSSGDTCSDGDLFRLYAAHIMSRDFLRVSSILHAVKSAAAAASFLSSGQLRWKVTDGNKVATTYHVIVLAVRMDQSEFVVIHTRSVVCTNRPVSHGVSYRRHSSSSRQAQLTVEALCARCRSRSRPECGCCLLAAGPRPAQRDIPGSYVQRHTAWRPE